MTTDDMLKVLGKLCGRATVVHVNVGNCFRIYLGDIFVDDASLPPCGFFGGDYWTVDAGTQDITVLRAYDRLYFELVFWCGEVEAKSQ